MNETNNFRLAAAVEYSGGPFKGWQWQSNAEPTIQPLIENAISRVANHPVKVFCAGRTDAGVHATRQIIHFDSTASRSPYSWCMGANRYLPSDIALKWVVPISQNFHARFSAFERHYRYVIVNTPVKPALFNQQLTWVRQSLDIELMAAAAQHLKGTHDFSSFRAADCQAKTPIKTVNHVEICQYGNLIVLDIAATAFLYHMVRNIMGVLIKVGRGEASPDWVKQVLEAKDRRKADVTAPAEGLYFVNVRYPSEFELPTETLGPIFVSALRSTLIDQYPKS